MKIKDLQKYTKNLYYFSEAINTKNQMLFLKQGDKELINMQLSLLTCKNCFGSLYSASTEKDKDLLKKLFIHSIDIYFPERNKFLDPLYCLCEYINLYINPEDVIDENVFYKILNSGYYFSNKTKLANKSDAIYIINSSEIYIYKSSKV